MNKTITALTFTLMLGSVQLNAINIPFLTKNKKEVRAEIAKTALVAGSVAFILGACSSGWEKRAFLGALYASATIALATVMMDVFDEFEIRKG